MIRAVGIDIVSVERIAKAMARPGFLERILTEKEMAYCRTPQQVAGRWAAKEALAKCIPHLRSWTAVEILPDAEGRPQAKFLREGRLSQGDKVHLSISHERGTAVAVAVLEVLTIP
ncbi:MAG: holo-ACP synthase [Fimbriimonadaceae bacterium]|jgi:holo-[acyl-carrier protein] synthase|nr:holo-ACP synthase [Fimbriimonadaceae bacterium]